MPDRSLLLYDGHCAFCTGVVRRLEAWDHGGLLEMVPANSERGRQVVAARGVTADLSATVVLLQGNQELVRSDAVLEALRLTGGARKVLARLALVVPRTWRDRVYDLVARNRGKLAGKVPLVSLQEKGRGQDDDAGRGP